LGDCGQGRRISDALDMLRAKAGLPLSRIDDVADQAVLAAQTSRQTSVGPPSVDMPSVGWGFAGLDRVDKCRPSVANWRELQVPRGLVALYTS
jgi:hypothetical protein